MAEFTTFKVGDKLTVLPHRLAPWMTEYGEMTVVEVHTHNNFKDCGHHQSLVMDKNGAFSGWWFDPKAPELFVEKTVE